MFIKIPKKGVPANIRKQVEAALPEPLVVAGWKFVRYVWRRLDQINTKDADGNSDNTVRIGGTGVNDVLKTSLEKGLNTSKLTPSIFPDENLLNGFNRYKNLALNEYEEWIFAEYEIDQSTKTEFQVTKQDFIDDFRAAANGGDGAKIITKEELNELGRKRFENREDRSKKAVARWVHSLDLNLSNDQVNGIAQTISKDFARRGFINSFGRDEAEAYLANKGIGADVLNTKDNTRTLRMFPKIMKNYVNNGTIFKYVDFHSDATTHKEIDDGREDSQNELLIMHNLCIDYAATVTKNQGKISWQRLGSLAQKINAEKEGTDGLAVNC
tara:strand:- start:766 stop:1746 length:981 start_codon:yes stop_codon:yes gene_type:complete